MKKVNKKWLASIVMCLLMSGCAAGTASGNESQSENVKVFEGATVIVLSDDKITVDGEAISSNQSAAVYAANDIVYYEEGKDFTYGEGTAEDAHSKVEADAHTVVHITEAGTYALSGTLSKGQIAIDLGEDAEEDPEAAVTLILNGADITCTVAPAIIFYNVYECGDSDEERASKDVDTSIAGANVLIADDTVNNIYGSYVARIYKEGTVELNETQTEVVDAKKLHKYDAAFYSKMTMNVNGDEKGSGVLNIQAENEGLDSELHLTINGGIINITSGNDGINTNEDGVSVTTINGGTLRITVDGATGEGDGIDSNGWLVINGGTVIASACSFSGDSGIDSDMGIHINGGTVIAGGNMLDHISESEQNYAVFTFNSVQSGDTVYTLKDQNGMVKAEMTLPNDFSIMIVSVPELEEGSYTFWKEETQLSVMNGQGGMGFGGMMRPDGNMRPEHMEIPEGVEWPENMEMPEGMERPEMPENMEIPEGMERPEGQWPDGEKPQGGRNPQNQAMGNPAELSNEFVIVNGGTYFSNINEKTE